MTAIVLSYQSLFDVPQPAAQTFPWINFNSAIDASALPQPPARPPIRQRYAGTKGSSVFGVFTPYTAMGWEVQPPQPPARPPTRNRYTAIRCDDGNYAPQINLKSYGWEFTPPVTKARPKNVAVTKGRGEFAYQGPFYPYGWEVQPPQPPHPRPERFGAVARGEDGIEAVFSLNPAATAWGYEPQLIARAIRPLGGAIAHGDDGNEYIFLRWQNGGWEIAPHQPQHPRPEKSGAIVRNEEGIEATFIFTVTATAWGYEPQSIARARPPSLRHSATKGRTDFGVFGPSIAWGWEPQVPQPPRPSNLKLGAISQRIFFVSSAVAPPPPPALVAPPGGGDYPRLPGQRKPIQPIWDRKRSRLSAERSRLSEGATENTQEISPELSTLVTPRVTPPPLPPAELFGVAGKIRIASFGTIALKEGGADTVTGELSWNDDELALKLLLGDID